MTLYATGVRRTELAHLKVTDVDSERMVLHIQGGKGRKDRDVVAQPPSARRTPTALSPAGTQTGHVVICRRAAE
jgi:site-specific recombinase XerD